LRQNKRWFVIIAALLAVIGVVLFLIFRSSPQPQSKPTELDSPGTVVIDNTDQLRDILLRREYAAVNEELVKYIQDHVSDAIEHAFLVNQPVINSDGVVSFTVQTEAPNKQFSVKLDRNTYFNKIIFSIPEVNYQSTLDVYATEEIGD